MKPKHFLLSTAICLAVFLTSSSINAETADITATVPGCGDGIVGVGEVCDNSDLGGASCATQGFTGGSLACTALCSFDTSACTLGGSGGGGGNRAKPANAGLETKCKIADFNCDRYVNIFDLSILLYYLEHSDQNIALYDLNKDDKVGFTDISIMFYYWDTA